MSGVGPKRRDEMLLESKYKPYLFKSNSFFWVKLFSI